MGKLPIVPTALFTVFSIASATTAPRKTTTYREAQAKSEKQHRQRSLTGQIKRSLSETVSLLGLW
jgi:hypothetical protein